MKTIQKKRNTGKKRTSNAEIMIGIGLIAIISTGAILWYRNRKRKKEEALLWSSNPTTTGSTRSTSTRTTSPVRTTRFRCTNSTYPLAYGTCHKDVKVVQSYLVKTYKADIGASGKNKDGVDGMFGSKTNRAVKKHLGKVSFDKKDIEGMKLTLKTIKR